MDDAASDKKDSIKTNIVIVAILTIVLAVVVVVSDGGNAYFKLGPDKNLHFISFTIDSTPKYIGVMIGIIPLAWMDVYSYDNVMPYLEPRIFYDGSPVTDWVTKEKWALAFWAELSYGTTNFRNLLDTLISVTNFYFAIWRWIVKELLCVYFINSHLKDKEKQKLWDNQEHKDYRKELDKKAFAKNLEDYFTDEIDAHNGVLATGFDEEFADKLKKYFIKRKEEAEKSEYGYANMSNSADGEGSLLTRRTPFSVDLRW